MLGSVSYLLTESDGAEMEPNADTSVDSWYFASKLPNGQRV